MSSSRAATHVALVVVGGVLVGMLGIASLGRARAIETPMPSGLYPLQAITETWRSGASRVQTPDGMRFVDVGARIDAPVAVLFANDNANAQFQLFARYTSRRPCGEVLLVEGFRALPSGGYGQDDSGCSVSFTLDAETATRIASMMGIPRQDRHAIGEAVVGTFRSSQATYRRGEPVEIVLAFENPATAPAVGRLQGGRQRGPRDNQFSFTVLRDGRAVTPIEGMDFGGLSWFAPMAPGATSELRAPLASWAALTEPGAYEVTCVYETSFSPAGVNPYDETHRGEVWDRTFTGTVRFTIR